MNQEPDYGTDALGRDGSDLAREEREKDDAITTSHTPGPWSVTEHNWSDTTIYGPNRDSRICRISIADEATEENQSELEAIASANARLIAAAPDLLAALGTMSAVFMAMMDGLDVDLSSTIRVRLSATDEAVWETSLQKVVDDTQAALAKAGKEGS